MELWAPKDHPYYGFGKPNSIIVVYMEPLGKTQPINVLGSYNVVVI